MTKISLLSVICLACGCVGERTLLWRDTGPDAPPDGDGDTDGDSDTDTDADGDEDGDVGRDADGESDVADREGGDADAEFYVPEFDYVIARCGGADPGCFITTIRPTHSDFVVEDPCRGESGARCCIAAEYDFRSAMACAGPSMRERLYYEILTRVAGMDDLVSPVFSISGTGAATRAGLGVEDPRLLWRVVPPGATAELTMGSVPIRGDAMSEDEASREWFRLRIEISDSGSDACLPESAAFGAVQSLTLEEYCL